MRLDRPWRRAILIVPVAVILAAFVVAIGVANSGRSRSPAAVLDIVPFDAMARALAAETLLSANPSAADLARSEELALGALERSPLMPQAARVLGFVAEFRRNQALARERIQIAAKLSKRDLPTRLWLIEEAVRRNDVSGALSQFDIAMRTSVPSRAILFPVLGNALADDSYVAPIADLLARRSDWLGDFAIYTLQKGDAARNLARAVANIPALDRYGDGHLEDAIIAQLVKEQRFSDAYDFAKARAGDPPAEGLVIGPTFKLTRWKPPFDWALVESAAMGAERADDGARIYANPGDGGVVASQLLVLQPGTYRLLAIGTAKAQDPDGGASWSIECAGNASKRLINLDLPRTHVGSVGIDLEIPAVDCPAQWLRLSILATDAPQGVAGVIKQVTLVRK